MTRSSSLEWHLENAASSDFICLPSTRSSVRKMVDSFIAKYPDFCRDIFGRSLTVCERHRVLSDFLIVLGDTSNRLYHADHDTRNSTSGSFEDCLSIDELNDIYKDRLFYLPSSLLEDSDSDSE